MSDEVSRRNDRGASISRRKFVESAAGAGLATWGLSAGAGCADHAGRTANVAAALQANEANPMNSEGSMSDEIVKAKIRRALLSGPDFIT
jgi:hypothetical protein